STIHVLLEREAQLLQEASEALPHSFEKCTYLMGPIRQAVYWCKTCAEPRGICSACSIACHGDHEQVELFPKRGFTCDCPTSCLNTQCQLHRTLEAPNTTNIYGQNFRGEFCRCGKAYNAETEEETMIQCVSCEDWFHESCLHLRDSESPGNPAPETDGEEVDEEEDPNLLLKPSQYESLICGACVRKHELLHRWAGAPGVRMLIWKASAAPEASSPNLLPGKWEIGGSDANEPQSEEVDVDITSNEAESSLVHPTPELSTTDTVTLKRPRSPSPVTCTAPYADALFVKAIASSSKGPYLASRGITLGDGDSDADMFLSSGWRDRWCRCADCLPSLERCPYFMEEAETYEPPEDPDAQASFEELGMRALERLPRERTLDGIRAYNTMRDDLMSYLKTFADGGKIVSENDVKSYF
ncbi:hypothetical protein DL93DRAFT_2028668, partial [Clavulina sp. PMI_390]